MDYHARARLVIAFLAVLGVIGCATRADLENVRKELRDTRALLADTQVSVEGLRRQMDTVRAQGQDASGRPAGRGSGDLERRLAMLEAQQAASTSSTGLPTPPPPPQPGLANQPTPPAEPAPPRGSEAAAIALRAEGFAPVGANETYRAALEAYRQGQWASAISQFRDFLRSAPKSDLADNAQYWIGESCYNQRDFSRAIIELNEVLIKYPQGDRVPGALLALATSFADSGDKVDARLILQKLISDHPNTEEARIGRQKLQTLTQ